MSGKGLRYRISPGMIPMKVWRKLLSGSRESLYAACAIPFVLRVRNLPLFSSKRDNIVIKSRTHTLDGQTVGAAP